jgi:hypothetical protein
MDTQCYVFRFSLRVFLINSGYFFRKMSRWSKPVCFWMLKSNISNNLLKFWKLPLDLAENEKCLFTSLQFVESSLAPYQRIRFFNSIFFKMINFSIIIHCLNGQFTIFWKLYYPTRVLQFAFSINCITRLGYPSNCKF